MYTDEELALMYQKGDTHAGSTLADRYYKHVYNRLNCILNHNNMSISDDVMDDMVQAGMVNFRMSMERFDPSKAKFITYALWMAQNLAQRELNSYLTRGITYLKKHTKPTLESIFTGSDDKDDIDLADRYGDDSVLDAVRVLELRDKINVAINKIDNPLKADCLRKFYGIDCEHMSADEIAKVNNISRNTVLDYIWKAKGEMYHYLYKYYMEGL